MDHGHQRKSKLYLKSLLSVCSPKLKVLDNKSVAHALIFSPNRIKVQVIQKRNNFVSYYSSLQ